MSILKIIYSPVYEYLHLDCFKLVPIAKQCQHKHPVHTPVSSTAQLWGSHETNFLDTARLFSKAT